MKCEYCQAEHDGKYGSGRFCCKECARGFSTKAKRKETNQKTSLKLKDYFKTHIPLYMHTVCKISLNKCAICGKQFLSRYKKVVCSKECRNQKLSIARSAKIAQSGSTNFQLKRQRFAYSGFDDYCDSKMEEAAIIYLFDALQASFIERFHSILNFKDTNGVNRRFNPDFICKINGEVFIVEVKSKWAINHSYSKNLSLKQKAIKDFCDKRGYQYIWLTEDNKDFNSAYRKHLKQ